MKSLPSSLAALVMLSGLAVQAQEPKDPAPTPSPAAPAEPASPAPTPAAKPDKDALPSQEELEAKFKATLTKATMSGTWCMVKAGQAQPAQADKYTIVGVNKLFGENWLVRARIQYGKRDVTAPIPIKVKWAGDTPVITVDGFGLGGNALYSARVLVYGHAYAGTWSAGDHGGLMSGVILPNQE